MDDRRVTLTHFDENGNEYIDMYDYADIVCRAPMSVRASIIEGNRFRKLRAIQVRTRFYVEKNELYIYPYIAPGKQTSAIYHYDSITGELVICEECTLGKRCLKVDENGNYIGHDAWIKLQEEKIKGDEKNEDDSVTIAGV